jgi:transcription antitermination protein NusB
MISRRLIRIKIVQVLYAYFSAETSTMDKADRELTRSLKNTYDLYHLFTLLLVNVADYAAARIELALNKNLPTHEDLNPNTRLVENKVIARLRDSHSFNSYVSQNKLSWFENPELVKKLYLKIIDTDYYKQYMSVPSPSFNDDKQLLANILTYEFDNWDFLYQLLEEKSIYWNDDIEFVIGMLVNTIDRFRESAPSINLLPMYKSDDDREFGERLLRRSILKHDEYRKLIEKYTQNWDLERIAHLDVIMMEVALTEITEFPSIPVKVTFNEFIDIARFYSTQKSNEFINGILDKIVADLRKENKVVKTGRGLVGENEVEA